LTHLLNKQSGIANMIPIKNRTYIIEYKDPENTVFDYNGRGVYLGKTHRQDDSVLYEFLLTDFNSMSTVGIFKSDNIVNEESFGMYDGSSF
jgi:hypothetical protein